jgi:hypothetical protein
MRPKPISLPALLMAGHPQSNRRVLGSSPARYFATSGVSHNYIFQSDEIYNCRYNRGGGNIFLPFSLNGSPVGWLYHYANLAITLNHTYP